MDTEKIYNLYKQLRRDYPRRNCDTVKAGLVARVARDQIRKQVRLTKFDLVADSGKRVRRWFVRPSDADLNELYTTSSIQDSGADTLTFIVSVVEEEEKDLSEYSFRQWMELCPWFEAECCVWPEDRNGDPDARPYIFSRMLDHDKHPRMRRWFITTGDNDTGTWPAYYPRRLEKAPGMSKGVYADADAQYRKEYMGELQAHADRYNARTLESRSTIRAYLQVFAFKLDSVYKSIASGQYEEEVSQQMITSEVVVVGHTESDREECIKECVEHLLMDYLIPGAWEFIRMGYPDKDGEFYIPDSDGVSYAQPDAFEDTSDNDSDSENNSGNPKEV